MKNLIINLKILPAQSNEAHLLTQVAFQSKAYWGYPPEWLEMWHSLLEVSEANIKKDHVFKAINEEGDILGFYSLSFEKDKWILSGFWVLPKHMGKGIGKALFQHMLVMAQQLHIELVEWDSDPNAFEFYLHMGAYKIGDKKYFLKGQERILPIMQIAIDLQPKSPQ